MVRMLDIISDYMRLRGFQHQRLDGSTPAAQRHQVRRTLRLRSSYPAVISRHLTAMLL
jgi:hypothetical protein